MWSREYERLRSCMNCGALDRPYRSVIGLKLVRQRTPTKKGNDSIICVQKGWVPCCVRPAELVTACSEVGALLFVVMSVSSDEHSLGRQTLSFSVPGEHNAWAPVPCLAYDGRLRHASCLSKSDYSIVLSQTYHFGV